jgi:hypothetical protein
LKNRRHYETKTQQGAAVIEFAFVVIAFFTLLLGIIEFGRFMYLWNTVQEVTRIAARQATVSDFSAASITAIQRTAVFNAGSTGAANLPAGGEITFQRVSIQYLLSPDVDDVVEDMPASPADNIAACLDADRSDDGCIRYVKASICEQSGQGNNASCNPVPYVPMIGLFDFLAINIPMATVVMPAESLGYSP